MGVSARAGIIFAGRTGYGDGMRGRLAARARRGGGAQGPCRIRHAGKGESAGEGSEEEIVATGYVAKGSATKLPPHLSKQRIECIQHTTRRVARGGAGAGGLRRVEGGLLTRRAKRALIADCFRRGGAAQGPGQAI